MTSVPNREEVRRTNERIRLLTMSRRTIFYLLKTILLITGIFCLCLFAFLIGSRTSNAYILVNEGMSLRAEAILQSGEVPELAGYMTQACLHEDAAQRAQSAAPYSGYTVTSYDYSISVDRLHLYPWHSELYVDVVEQIGSISISVADNSSTPELPKWTPIKYRLYLEKHEGRWFIGRIQLLELNPSIPPANTPDPYLEPLPMVTPAPEVPVLPLS